MVSMILGGLLGVLLVLATAALYAISGYLDKIATALEAQNRHYGIGPPE